jgi:twitching motility protein PilT
MSDAGEFATALLQRMAATGASDLHIASNAAPVYRIDGMLEPASGADALTPERVGDIIEALTTEGERHRLETERELDKALALAGGGRFRMNVGYDRGAPYATFRRINTHIPSLEELALPPVCERMTQLPRGLVLVTGPTGSGKSTTLAAMIDRINERDRRHIITIEDPIEYLHGNKRSMINQREVGADTRSFASALRHCLRQDPDVIMIGEMRDLETMASAITAAETGHLVFATLHTPDAPQTVDRIVDAFPAHQQQQIRLQLSMVIEAIISQVLLPADGGRIAACEVLIGTPAVRTLIREGKTHQLATAMATGAQQDMRTLDQQLATLVQQVRISRETALSFARTPAELERLLSNKLPHAA